MIQLDRRCIEIIKARIKILIGTDCHGNLNVLCLEKKTCVEIPGLITKN